MSKLAPPEHDTKNKTLLGQRFRGFLPVIIDIETGGFNCETDALLEIAAVTLDMDANGRLFPDELMSYHIDPFEGANLEPSALSFTGIDPECPDRDALPEMIAIPELFRPIRKAVKHHGCTRAVMVAHNAHFDLGFLNAVVRRCEIKRNPFHPFSCFDTATLSGLALGQTVLAKACQTAGIDFNNQEAHSAAYDAERTAELFCLITNRWMELGGWPLAGPTD